MSTLGVRLNLSNGGLSQVRGWTFNSVAELEDKLLGASASGMSELGAETDALSNIDSSIKLPISDFAVKQPKRIRKGYMDYETNGKLAVKCIANENASFTVTIPASPDFKETSIVFNGRRDQSGTNWEFELTNINGADFALDYFGILFIPLTRSRNL